MLRTGDGDAAPKEGRARGKAAVQGMDGDGEQLRWREAAPMEGREN